MSIIETLATIRQSSTFLTLKGYKSATSGEVADHQIVFHMSYQSALEKSITALETVIPADDLEAQAKSELLASYQKSLDKVRTEPLEVVGDHYDRVLDAEGNHIKGCKVHRESGELHLFGLALRKTVLIPGTYKEVKSRPLTLAKDKLRKGLPVERFRQFIIKPGQVEEIRIENLSLLPE
jgi:hypothetical protein